MSTEPVALMPQCEECDRVWLPDERDCWRCYLDDEDNLVFYWPVCAKREFGDA
jgi:uncharacterized OB-fold protein